MTEKEFFNHVANGQADVVHILLNAFAKTEADYCVIGGLAVNAYAEPVVSLDLGIMVDSAAIERVCDAAESGFLTERFSHTINLTNPHLNMRVEIQTDPRYQEFLQNAAERDVLGYRMKVASVEDVLKGKVWAYSDEQRRKSKRQKDLADIVRLVEARPELVVNLPPALREKVESL